MNGGGPDGSHVPKPQGPPGTGRPAGSSSLATLARLIDSSIDQEYLEAAQRRRERAAGLPPARNQRPRRAPAPRSFSFLVVALVAGLLLTVAALHVRDRAPAVARAHDALVERIDAVTAANDRLEDTSADLQAKIVKARDAALTVTTLGDQLTRELRMLSAATGSIAVTGPGITVTLDDAPGADTGPAENLGLIYDRDLQAVVNALWASGAEAIAINHQRLSGQTAIRSAGAAILVDFRPLTRPYVIEAIGSDQLEATFADSATGRLYRSWKQIYGIGFSTKSAQRLTLLAAANISLRYATIPTSTPVPTAPADPHTTPAQEPDRP